MMVHKVDFIGGDIGKWKVVKMENIVGPHLHKIAYVDVLPNNGVNKPSGIWKLTGVSSNQRYTEKNENEQLSQKQARLGRELATCAALIPIRKTEAWWALAQDERRFIFEDRSRHITMGLNYLPAIARKLFHCKDLGEPFDFITWFEYEQKDSEKFDKLLALLRKTEEWKYVEREVDIRMVKA